MESLPFALPEDALGTAATTIRGRIRGLQAIHASYLAYQQYRVDERDHHGAWDAAINLAETEAEIAGLEFALNAMGAG